MQTIADTLRRITAAAPGRTAVIAGDQRMSFAEFGERCGRLAGALHGLGLSRGDRVAILASNGHEYLECYVGAPAAGFVIVPLNTRHASPELEYAVRDSGARLLLTDRPAGTLAGCVERVVTFGEEYETLLAAAPSHEPGTAVAAQDLAGLFYTGGTTGESKGVMLSHANLVANARHWQTNRAAGRGRRLS